VRGILLENVQHHEADFVVVQNRKVEQIIQVCWNIDKPTTKEREIRALVTAGEELKCKKLLILTESNREQKRLNGLGKKRR